MSYQQTHNEHCGQGTPLDDMADGDVAVAALASRMLRAHPCGQLLGVRPGSRLAQGLIALHKSGCIRLKVLRESDRTAPHDDLVHVAFQRRGARR